MFQVMQAILSDKTDSTKLSLVFGNITGVVCSPEGRVSFGILPHARTSAVCVWGISASTAVPYGHGGMFALTGLPD